jgi:hypothetical protein
MCVIYSCQYYYFEAEIILAKVTTSDSNNFKLNYRYDYRERAIDEQIYIHT